MKYQIKAIYPEDFEHDEIIADRTLKPHSLTTYIIVEDGK